MEKVKLSIHYKWVVMSVVSVGSLLSALDSGAVRIVLPHLGHVFQIDVSATVWVLLIYLLASTSLMLIFGRAGDVFGRKRLYSFGLIIHTLGLGFSAMSHNLIQLIMSRLLQAVGVSMTVATGYALITAAFPSKERGKALGILGAVSAIGLLGGPVAGGFFLDIFGWRSIFYFRLPFGIIGIIMTLALLKEQVFPICEEKFDLFGATALFATLTCLPLIVNQGQSLRWASPWVVSLCMTGVVSLSIFLIVELKVPQPILDLRLFCSRLFTAACVSHVFLHMSLTAVSFLMPFYLIQGIAFNASKAGLFLVAIPATSLVLSPVSGWLSDKLGTLLLSTSGLTIVCAGFLLLSTLGANASTGKIVLYLVILGLGKGLFVSPNISAIMGSVSAGKLGTASAMIGTLRQTGITIGLTIASSVFVTSQNFHANQLASQGLIGDMIHRLSTINGFHDAIFIIFFTAVAGLVTCVFRGRR